MNTDPTPDFLEEIATEYSLRLLDSIEQDPFNDQTQPNPDVAKAVSEAEDLHAAILLAEARLVNRIPGPSVLASILQKIENVPQHIFPTRVVSALTEAGMGTPKPKEAVVFTDRKGLVRWVNPAFTELCGYSLDELYGKKAGKMLQGAMTDPDAIHTMRQAIFERLPVVQRIVNYHKDGTAYHVEIDLRPVSAGFIAVERDLGKF